MLISARKNKHRKVIAEAGIFNVSEMKCRLLFHRSFSRSPYTPGLEAQRKKRRAGDFVLLIVHGEAFRYGVLLILDLLYAHAGQQQILELMMLKPLTTLIRLMVNIPQTHS